MNAHRAIAHLRGHRDKYDKAMEYLRRNPNEIYDMWLSPRADGPGCLFQYAGRRGGDPGSDVGCLTMIRNGCWSAQTDALTEAIRADERIPIGPGRITPANLYVFAEWQRRLDRELGA